MSTPYQNWISETNAVAGQGKVPLAERLARRLLEKHGPPPTADDINWLDLIIDAYSNAGEPERKAYAQVMLDWLDSFFHTFGRGTVSAQSVTQVCSALSFWQACAGGFTEQEHRHFRAFLGGFLDQAAAFATLPAPLNDAGDNLHEQIMRLYYSGPGSEHFPKDALLGRWLPVSQHESKLSLVDANLRNNRLIMEALALHHPYSVTYDWVHHLFRDSKALPDDRRDLFLEQTFTAMDLAESWTQVNDGNANSPRDRLFGEVKGRCHRDDFESIEEALRFIDQVFWLVGDQTGEFARWKDKKRSEFINLEISSLANKYCALAPDIADAWQVIGEPARLASDTEKRAYLIEKTIFIEVCAEHLNEKSVAAWLRSIRTAMLPARYREPPCNPSPSLQESETSHEIAYATELLIGARTRAVKQAWILSGYTGLWAISRVAA